MHRIYRIYHQAGMVRGRCDHMDLSWVLIKQLDAYSQYFLVHAFRYTYDCLRSHAVVGLGCGIFALL